MQRKCLIPAKIVMYHPNSQEMSLLEERKWTTFPKLEGNTKIFEKDVPFLSL